MVPRNRKALNWEEKGDQTLERFERGTPVCRRFRDANSEGRKKMRLGHLIESHVS